MSLVIKDNEPIEDQTFLFLELHPLHGRLRDRTWPDVEQQE